MATESPDAWETGQGSSLESAGGQMGYEESGEGFAQADPDVVLDVPVVKVEELSLEVEDLKARVALRGRLAELLEIDVGVDISVSAVKLETKGVEATARLKARLENVDSMIHRTLDSVDDNPGLVREFANMSEARRGGQEGSHGQPEVTEAARSRAEELGVSLSNIRGTGFRGRIVLRDVQRAAKGS